jgi:hypothetical protein
MSAKTGHGPILNYDNPELCTAPSREMSLDAVIAREINVLDACEDSSTQNLFDRL